MQDRVFIENLRIDATHGVRERERKESQEFILDMSVVFDTDRASRSDKLDDTYDYGRLRAIALDVFAGAPNYLIERLAERIAQEVLDDTRVVEVTVTIRKPHVYPDCVPGMTLTRKQAASL